MRGWRRGRGDFGLATANRCTRPRNGSNPPVQGASLGKFTSGRPIDIPVAVLGLLALDEVGIYVVPNGARADLKTTRAALFLSPIRYLRCRHRRFVQREWPLSSYHIAEKLDGHIYLDELALGL